MEVTWDVTHECNLSCRHCYVEEHNTGELGEKEEEKLLKELVEIGIDNLAISGGEPFLKKNLAELTEEIKSHGMKFSILTNGTVVDYGIIERAEPEAVQVSIDGTKEFHDSFRGAPSYNRAVETLRKLKDFDLTVAVSTTLLKDNSKQIRKLLEDISPFIDSYRGSLLAPVGRGKDIIDQALSPIEVIDVVKDFFGFERNYPEISFSFPREYVAQKALLNGEIGRRVFREYTETCSKCTAYQSIGITSNGNVLPCIFLQDNVMGNIKEEPLGKILNSRSELEKCSCQYSTFCSPCPARVLNESDVYCIKSLPSH